MLRDTDSAETVVSTFEGASWRFRSNPDLAGYADRCDATVAAIEDKQKRLRRAVGERMGATLIIRKKDKALNQALMAFSRAVHAKTNGNREAPEYTAAFHKPPSEIIRPQGGDLQAGDVELVLSALETSPLLAGFRDEHAPVIRAALTALTEAENHRKALYLAESVAVRELRMALDAAIAQYHSFRTPLMVHFQDDTDEVDSYLP